jgi:uncharacterized protein (TIGR02466 family)
VHRYNLFPVPVAHATFDRAQELCTEIVPIFKDIEVRDTRDHVGKYSTGSYTSFFSNGHIITMPQLESLRNFIKDTVQTLHQSVGLAGDLEFTNSWFSINRQHSYHEAHNHCPDIWSGVYYVQANQADAAISFVNKTLIDTGWPYTATKTANTDFVSNQVNCPVESGLLLVFPSYLVHKVNQQEADSERITIAFNMSVKT